MSPQIYRVAAASLALFSLATVACSSDKGKPSTNAAASSSAATGAPPVQRAAQAAADAGPPPPRTAATEFSENDFVESDKSRDPFRNFAKLFVEQNSRPTRIQRDVLLPQYTIDELKLVAIVLSGDFPRAMFVDPTGKGWVIRRGDFIGRPDLVHVGGTNGTDYQLNWRVEKVRDGDVVLLREDPAQPSIPPATRVVSIRPEATKEDQTIGRN
jgi:type IV pilus assembly protein PilP